MKTINLHQETYTQEERFSKLRGKLSLPVKGETRAQDAAIALMQEMLDNKYVLVRNIGFAGNDGLLIMVLVGPPGVQVIYATDIKGVFRAREGSWEELDDREQRFKDAQPNLVQSMADSAKWVEEFLSSRFGIQMPVEAVLYFSDPGVHISLNRPIVRVILSDALERYILNLPQRPQVFSQEHVQPIVDAFSRAGGQGQTDSVAEIRDAFSFVEAEQPAARPTPPPRSEPGWTRKAAFNRRQWIILGLLLGVNIFLLVCFLLYMLRSV